MSDESPAVLHEGRNEASVFDRVIALGWYDGPTQGLLRTSPDGTTYRFELIDPRQQADDRDERVYALFPVPGDEFDRFVEQLSILHTPNWPVWFPVWTFPSDELKDAASALTKAIAAQAGRSAWVVVGAIGTGAIQAKAVPLSRAS